MSTWMSRDCPLSRIVLPVPGTTVLGHTALEIIATSIITMAIQVTQGEMVIKDKNSLLKGSRGSLVPEKHLILKYCRVLPAPFSLNHISLHIFKQNASVPTNGWEGI